MKYSETKSNLFLTKFISEEKFLNFSLMLHDMDTKVTFSSTMVYACSNISKVLKVFFSLILNAIYGYGSVKHLLLNFCIIFQVEYMIICKEISLFQKTLGRL